MAHPYYTIKELCRVFDISLSTYFEQIKDKPIAEEKKKIISIIKQTAKETKNSYGKRRMKKRLNNHGIDIGIHKTVSLMKEAQIVAIRPRKRHYYPNGGISNVKVKNGNLISQRQIHTGCQTSHIFATTRVGVIWLQFLIWEQKKLLVGHYRKPLIQSLPCQH